MGGRRSLQSVAAGVAGAFRGRNNDIGGYWGPGVLLAALPADSPEFEIDLIAGTARPDLVGREFEYLARRWKEYYDWALWRPRVPRSSVGRAVIRLSFDSATFERRTAGRSVAFVVRVEIVDDRNRSYVAEESGSCRIGQFQQSVGGWWRLGPHRGSNRRGGAPTAVIDRQRNLILIPFVLVRVLVVSPEQSDVLSRLGLAAVEAPWTPFAFGTPLDRLRTTNNPDGRQFLLFSRLDNRDVLALDSDTGAVVAVFDPERSYPAANVVSRWNQYPVNTDLASFRATVRAVIERFPYYPHLQAGDDAAHEAWDRQRDRADADLRALILGLDPDALGQDGFWSDFLDSVFMGDWATEQILDVGLPVGPVSTVIVDGTDPVEPQRVAPRT